jgi:GTP1/Obg family GTP-binding protein
MNKIPLRARIRPNIEAAPWVIDELAEIERDLAAVTAERDTYKKALHGISLGSQNSMTSKDDLGREARAAIDAAKGGQSE